MSTIKEKAKKVWGWIVGGVLGLGLIIIGGNMVMEGTEDTPTDAYIDSVYNARIDSVTAVDDSLDLIASIEILVWNGEDNPDPDGNKKGDCIRVIKTPRKPWHMLEEIDPRFRIIRIKGKSMAEVDSLYCKDWDEGDTTHDQRVNSVPLDQGLIVEADSIKKKVAVIQ